MTVFKQVCYLASRNEFTAAEIDLARPKEELILSIRNYDQFLANPLEQTGLWLVNGLGTASSVSNPDQLDDAQVSISKRPKVDSHTKKSTITVNLPHSVEVFFGAHPQ